MRSPSLRFVLAVGLLALTSTPARADLPGNPVCDVEGKDCTSCWKEYGGENEDQFNECVASAKAKDLREVCKHRQGAGDSVFYCPKDVSPMRPTSPGGCASCAVGDEPTAPGAALAWLGLAALALLRRR